MRIVAGKFKGREIKGPASDATRPTSDRVRESLFNILAHGIEGFNIEGARVLDLFAGTGALGLEAISRGAKYCCFVEEDAGARGVIRTNADGCGVIGQTRIWRRDATDLGLCAPQSPYDLIFVDPPYAKGFGEKTLVAIIQGGWLADNGVVVLEESAKTIIADISGFVAVNKREYGDTQIVFFGLTTRRGSPAST